MAKSIGKKKMPVAAQRMIPPEYELGPAMKALTPRQQAFVMACMNMGVEVNYSQAARLAGYSDPGLDSSTVRVAAHNLIHDARIQAAIHEQGRKKLKAATLEATSFLVEVVQDIKGKYEVKDRLRAANSILDRGGLHALSEHQVTVTNIKSREEKLLEVAKLAKMLGRDPKELLGNMADALEGDFTTVKEIENVEGNAGTEQKD
jgi:Terminase small subunit